MRLGANPASSVDCGATYSSDLLSRPTETRFVRRGWNGGPGWRGCSHKNPTRVFLSPMHGVRETALTMLSNRHHFQTAREPCPSAAADVPHALARVRIIGVKAVAPANDHVAPVVEKIRDEVARPV